MVKVNGRGEEGEKKERPYQIWGSFADRRKVKNNSELELPTAHAQSRNQMNGERTKTKRHFVFSPCEVYARLIQAVNTHGAVWRSGTWCKKQVSLTGKFFHEKDGVLKLTIALDLNMCVLHTFLSQQNNRLTDNRFVWTVCGAPNFCYALILY